MKHRTNPVPFLIILALIGVIACSKRRDGGIGDKIMFFSYAQTQCADPWGYGNTDSLTLAKLRHYIDSAGLFGPLLSIQLKGTINDPATCLACTCPTGKVFQVAVMESAALKLKYLQAGFQPE